MSDTYYYRKHNLKTLLEVQAAGGLITAATPHAVERLKGHLEDPEEPELKELIGLMEAHAKARDDLDAFLRRHGSRV